MLIYAFHAALENGVKALNRVCADSHLADAIGVAIFLAGMINRAVFVKQLVKAAVGV
jgi:hypothetical protein